MEAEDPASHRPPAGGYGAAPPSTRFGPAPPIDGEANGPRRSLKPFVTAALLLVTLSTLIVLAVVGVRRYIKNAKTAEEHHGSGC